MNNPILYQVGIGLLTLFFFVLMYFFTKTWRWLHVTVMFFVFCASIAFAVYAAMSLKTHDAWRQLYRQQAAEVAAKQKENDLLLHGDLNVVVPETPPIRDLHAQLGRVLLDRGRVWSGCTAAGAAAADGTIKLSTVPPGVAEADATPNRIDQGMVMYLFTESPPPPELAPTLTTAAPVRFPQYYIGEFTATEVDNTTVTLRPTLPITALEREMMNIPAESWVLYETMPIDGHAFFADDPNKKTDLTKDADVEPVFGDIDQRKMAVLLARSAKRADETDEQFLQRFAEIRSEYERDGKRAADDDPPENRWLKVRFIKEHEETVDSDASLGAVISSEDFFDRGRAEIALLRRNEPAKFKRNDIGVFPPDDANRLIRDGVCELIEPIYVRSLHNYDDTFREIYQRVRVLEQDIADLKRNTAAIAEANRRSAMQIAYREQEKGKLQEDLTQYVYERDQIKQYRDELDKFVAAKLDRLSLLYRTNHQLAAELAQLERTLTAKINQRTLEAAGTP